MGLLFGSQEWIDAYAETVNSNAAYEDAEKNWEGDFMFIIEPDGNLHEELRFYVDLYHGKARNWRILSPGEEVETAYVFSGKWSNFELLLDGKLDPIKGLLARKFKLKGNMAAIVRAVKAAVELVKFLRSVDTDRF